MKEYRYYIKKINKKGDDTIVLELGDLRGIPVFDFQSGQYVMIYYKNAKGEIEQKHTFSIASSPLENGSIQLGIRVTGPFTRGLSKMKEGDEIFVDGPYGNFTFKKEKHHDLVFLAGGVGITPFISALRYATLHQLPNKMTLLYSNRTFESALFLEEILELEKKNKNLRTLLSVTDEKFPYKATGFINKRLSPEIIKNFIGHTHGKTFFLCGPQKFMEAMKENLKKIGVQDFQIETEGFSMIEDEGIWPKIRNTFYALSFAMAVFLLPFYFIYKSAIKPIITGTVSPEIEATSSTATSSGSVSSQNVDSSVKADSSAVTVAPIPTASKKVSAPTPSAKTRTS